MAAAKPKQPWERRTGEGDEAFSAFTSFRDQLPPRRLFSVRVGGIAVDAVKLSQWAAMHDWAARSAEYDNHLDGVRRGAREGQLALSVKDITARHVGIMAELSEVAQHEVTKLRMRVQDGSIGVLKAGELIKMIEQIVKLDRLILGETTENVGASYDFANLSTEELVLFTQLLAKATPKKVDE